MRSLLILDAAAIARWTSTEMGAWQFVHWCEVNELPSPHLLVGSLEVATATDGGRTVRYSTMVPDPRGGWQRSASGTGPALQHHVQSLHVGPPVSFGLLLVPKVEPARDEQLPL